MQWYEIYAIVSIGIIVISVISVFFWMINYSDKKKTVL